MDPIRDDTECAMDDIARQRGDSMISLLLRAQESGEPQEKNLEYLKALQCLRPARGGPNVPNSPWNSQNATDEAPTLLERGTINAFETRCYVTVSYTWKASPEEEEQAGGYAVQTRDGARFRQSKVRDCIFRRALNYMSAYGCRLLWIDQECIPQRTCNCLGRSHAKCREKQAGIETMDLVYRMSDHPIALLPRRIKTATELDLLYGVLSGDFVNGDDEERQFWISAGTRVQTVRDCLELLEEITSARWWTRAWTFQENYRAGHKMTLLIPHVRKLEMRKRSYPASNFGELQGELCIPSTAFSEEATRFCMAVKHSQLFKLSHVEEEAANKILRAAGKYTLLLTKQQSMSPRLIADLAARNLNEPWERLPVTANCCQYPIRLNTSTLLHERQSLSICMLAMCLCNGEILDNGRYKGENFPSVGHMTVAEYVNAHFFDGFQCPRDEERALTYNKSCRFFDVRLGEIGIMTRGYLWGLGRRIHTFNFPERLPWIREARGYLTLHQRKRLNQLAKLLRAEYNQENLAHQLEYFLHRDFLDKANNEYSETTFSQSYMHKMAVELVAAIDQQRSLQLGYLWGELPSDAIFVSENLISESRYSAPRDRKVFRNFAFTSTWPKDEGSHESDSNDIDRHVSLEVESADDAPQSIPQLYIKRWMLGLCFFKEQSPQHVVFPWPASLRAIQ